MKCAFCEKPMTGRKRKYCGKRCRSHGGRMQYQHTCRQCGRQFITDKTVSKFCGSDCYGQSIRKRPKTCEVCGVSFVPRDMRHARCCSRECGFALTTDWSDAKKTKDALARRRATLRKVLEKATVQITAKALRCTYCGNRGRVVGREWCQGCVNAFRYRSQGYSLYKTILCQHCRTPVRGRGPHTLNGATCDECRAEQVRAQKKRRRARKRGVRVSGERITLSALDERDGGICHLCKGIVDWSAHHTANRYPSIDHVIPLANGGSHTWDNVKLAHRLCNSRKGADQGVAPKKL